jgi:hypothetical protein
MPWISWLSEELLAYLEELCSVDLLNKFISRRYVF